MITLEFGIKNTKKKKKEKRKKKKDVSAIQSDLQIQCNKNSNHLFHRNGKPDPQINTELEGALLITITVLKKKKLEDSHFPTSKLATKLQQLKQYGTCTRIHRPME